MKEDTHSFQESDIINTISDYSNSGTLLSIMGGVNIQSEEMSDSSVTFFNFVNKLSLKCARKNHVNGEIDYIFIKEDIQSSKYVTGLYQNRTKPPSPEGGGQPRSGR